MQSLTEKFTELRQHLKAGVGNMKQTGFDPVYYLVFPASQILDAKQMLPEILAKLKLDGYRPEVFSVSSALNSWFKSHKMRTLWQDGLRREGNNYDVFRRQFAQKLEKDRVLPDAIQKKLGELATVPHALLLITDVEALHPFLHFSGIEQQLVGQFCVPTIVLYPGIRGGAYSLRFLGIHQENGNYRSIHVG
jgi:hypothetical protein